MSVMKPIIGITMGDPAGIGPEITVKALEQKKIYESCRPLVIGDCSFLEWAKEVTGHSELLIHPVQSPEEGYYRVGTIDVLDMQVTDRNAVPVGKISKTGGDGAFQYVKKAIELAMEGKIHGTVTNALNKEALNLAGHYYSGHTEIYAKFTGTDTYAMMLVWKNLRVLHVSTHISLAEACRRVKKERVLQVIELADKTCKQLGIANPRIAVAGLNPHCGEGGLFGREEIEEIIPAVEIAQKKGIGAEGPVPADTVFSKALGNWYDCVVAMYHDQGHIPLKVLGFRFDAAIEKWQAVEGVNITLGLPVIRTSVDHGTAFDQAGTGMANERSLINAIEYAAALADRHRIFSKEEL